MFVNILPIIQMAAFQSMQASHFASYRNSAAAFNYLKFDLPGTYQTRPSNYDRVVVTYDVFPIEPAFHKYKLAMPAMTQAQLDAVPVGEIVGMEIF